MPSVTRARTLSSVRRFVLTGDSLELPLMFARRSASVSCRGSWSELNVPSAAGIETFRSLSQESPQGNDPSRRTSQTNQDREHGVRIRWRQDEVGNLGVALQSLASHQFVPSEQKGTSEFQDGGGTLRTPCGWLIAKLVSAATAYPTLHPRSRPLTPQLARTTWTGALRRVLPQDGGPYPRGCQV